MCCYVHCWCVHFPDYRTVPCRTSFSVHTNRTLLEHATQPVPATAVCTQQQPRPQNANATANVKAKTAAKPVPKQQRQPESAERNAAILVTQKQCQTTSRKESTCAMWMFMRYANP